MGIVSGIVNSRSMSRRTFRKTIIGMIIAGAFPHAALSLDFLHENVDPRVTCSGGVNGTRINSAGTIVAAVCPRFDYNPVTRASLGVLIEEARTNILLNSLLNGANLSTQSVAVTAQAYTLSFYGTGTVTLSGTFVGSLVGSGAFPTRSTLTFTPIAGSLTLTVAGTVQFTNLEAGSFATSFIPTAGVAVARTVDAMIMTGTNFSSWYNQLAGTFTAQFDVINISAGLINTAISTSDGTASNRARIIINASNVYLASVDVGAVNQANMLTAGTVSVGTTIKAALAYTVNDFAAVRDGGTVITDNSGTLPVVDRINLGTGASNTQPLNGHLRGSQYYAAREPNTIMIAKST